MKEFDVTITETLKKTVTVQADSQEEAEDMVYDQHAQGIHVLDAGDFTGMTVETVAEREKLLTVLLVEPLKAPTEMQIPDTLKAFQSAVDGYIETLTMPDGAVLICNEEGKMNGSTLNRSLYNEDGERLDIIAGTFLVVGMGEESFDTLSPEAMSKYKAIFEKPEKFYKLAGKIISQTIEQATGKDDAKKITPER